MNKHPTLSLLSVILININIMFGTGIFINTLPLVGLVGPLGGLSYACIAVLIAPLVLCFSALIKKYPEGGMYAYASNAFGRHLGGLSNSVYFIAKLASAALLLDIALQCLSTLLGGMHASTIIMCKLGILMLYCLLNLHIFSTGRFLMYFFLMCKLFPIVVLIGCCIFTWHIPVADISTHTFYTFTRSLPLVLYAFTGFEACCSVSNFLANPAKDGPKALFISFGSVVGLTIIYQTIISLQLADQSLVSTINISNFFPMLFKLLAMNHIFAKFLSALLYGIVGCACLGGVYAILLSNYWNLYRLAEQKLVPYHLLFCRLNKYGIPYAAVIAEVIICIFYVLFVHNTALLQQLSVSGCVISFAISALALIKLGNTIERCIASIGFGTCVLIIYLIAKSYFLC